LVTRNASGGAGTTPEEEQKVSNSKNRELMNLVDGFAAGELSRRSFIRRMSGLGAGAMFGGAAATALTMRHGLAAPAGSSVGVRRAFQDPEPRAGGTIVAATIDKPVNMDPAFAELYSSMQVYQNIFDTLVYVDADYNFVPGLAKSWNQVDATTWELELVDNATFHNGEAFTSRDVAFSLERVFDPALGAPNAVFLQSIDRAETDGDYKVRFYLKNPSGSFLADLAAAFQIVNEKAVTTLDPRLEPVGTGPFKFTEWVKDDHITLSKWENYHKASAGLPYLDQVIFKAISDDTVRLTGLQTNELQWAMQVPLQKVEELKNEADIKVTVGKPYLPDMIYLNASKPPFDNKLVRQALAWCVNREEIVKVAFFGQAEEATEAVYSGNPYYTGINAYADGPDYDKAKALLAEAGMEGLEFQFDGQPQVPTQMKTAQVLQQQFQRAGINMTIQNYESGEWITRLFAKEYEATVSYWSATLDPVHFYLTNLLSTSGWNSTGYGTPEMDAALQAFAQETDLEARKVAGQQVVTMVQDEVPMIFLDNQLQQYWVRANVYGMEPLPTMEIRMEPVYIAE
jgi:peptide/nickel transport system substrate-binding protein